MTDKEGVNGAQVYTDEGVGDARVVLYQLLVRNCSPAEIKSAIQSAKEEHLLDYFVLAFQTRDIRGGKGEKDLFYTMLLELFQLRPALIKKAINLIPEYGCWQDCWKLWDLAGPDVHTAILELVRWIYFEDLYKLDAGIPVSLLGKWLPREGSKYDHLATVFANDFHSAIVLCESFKRPDSDRLRQYRKNCVKLNSALRTVEVDMCRHTWANINPAAVPGRLLARNRKAFLNESKTSGLRWPSNTDRMECRQRFIDHIKSAVEGKGSVAGADVVQPHEIVRAFLTGNLTEDEELLIQAQWNSIKEAAKSGLQGFIPMSDFSGSMSGTPMYVSMALGILLSEINTGAFKDQLLGFDEYPSWISFEGMTTLKEKIMHARGYAHGLNTNFLSAATLILNRLVENDVEQAPKDLIVFTDMGFDAAAGRNTVWETQLTNIQCLFQSYGYTAPRIVLWNLRSEFRDFHAKADTEGVVVLSGWSPSALKTLQTTGVIVQTPYEALRAILDSPRYDAVRAAFLAQSMQYKTI